MGHLLKGIAEDTKNIASAQDVIRYCSAFEALKMLRSRPSSASSKRYHRSECGLEFGLFRRHCVAGSEKYHRRAWPARFLPRRSLPPLSSSSLPFCHHGIKSRQKGIQHLTVSRVQPITFSDKRSGDPAYQSPSRRFALSNNDTAGRAPAYYRRHLLEFVAPDRLLFAITAASRGTYTELALRHTYTVFHFLPVKPIEHTQRIAAVLSQLLSPTYAPSRVALSLRR